MPNEDRFQKTLHGQRAGEWRISGALLRMAGAIAAMSAILAGVPAQAQTEKVIHNFRAGQDGDEPMFGLALHQGDLYGTSFHGGTAGFGEVFQLTRWTGHILWQKELLHSFLGGQGDDGGPPWGRVISDKAGNLYGTTVNNGPACCGVVYKVSPPAAGETNWTESIIYSFTGAATVAGHMAAWLGIRAARSMEPRSLAAALAVAEPSSSSAGRSLEPPGRSPCYTRSLAGTMGLRLMAIC
jgi:uncharacterized repeat protein (TIGR03803 family)